MLRDTAIIVPFARGDRISLPAGTVYRRGMEIRELKRLTHITVFSACNGWINLDPYRGAVVGKVHLPTVTWAGAGGGWSDVQFTPQLCEKLGIEVPVIPDMADEIDYYRFDTVPSYGGDGDDNRYRI